MSGGRHQVCGAARRMVLAYLVVVNHPLPRYALLSDGRGAKGDAVPMDSRSSPPTKLHPVGPGGERLLWLRNLLWLRKPNLDPAPLLGFPWRTHQQVPG